MSNPIYIDIIQQDIVQLDVVQTDTNIIEIATDNPVKSHLGLTDIGTNTHAQIDTAIVQVGTNTTNISTNTGNITTNTTDIGTNATNISTNTGNITTNTTNIGNNTTAIGTNTTNISTNTTDIGTNATNIGTNTTNIGTNTTNIGTNTTDIGTNATNIGTNTTNIGTNTTQIGTNTTNIGTNTTDIGNNTTQIGTNTTNIGNNTTQIGTNTTNIGTNTTNIGNNTTQIGTNTTNISTNTGNIGTNTTDIGTNATNIATNTSDITTNAFNIATNTADIAALGTSTHAQNTDTTLDIGQPNQVTSAELRTHIDLTNEHIDWTGVGAGTIDPSNYTDNDTTDHTLLSNIGTNTHAQIDTAVTNSTNHIANTTNPHSVTAAQVGSPSLQTMEDQEVFRANGTSGEYEGSDVFISDTGVLRPKVDEAQDLGSQTVKWDKLFTRLGVNVAGSPNITLPAGNHGGIIGGTQDGIANNCHLGLNGLGYPAVATIGNVRAGLGGSATVESIKGGAIAMGSAFTSAGTALVSSGGYSSTAIGYAYGEGTSTLRSLGSGSCAFGYARARDATGAGTLSSSGGGSFAAGNATNFSGIGTANIQSSGGGSFAQGAARADSGFSASILATGAGSFAQGRARTHSNGTINIQATGAGSFAQGYVKSGFNITASGDGAFAQGYANSGAIEALSNNAAQFGVGTNNTTNSFKIGRHTLFHHKGMIEKALDVITAVNTTIGLDHHTVLCDASSNAVTIDLPAAASSTNRMYYIKAIDATNTITIDPNLSETIDGATTRTLTANQGVIIQCDGTAWYILADV